MSEQTQPNPGLPEVRNFPVWKGDDLIEVSGAEWEAVNNFIDQAQGALYAVNSVMSRNIVKGTIKMKFEKLNKATLSYEPMTAEEEAPYQEELAKAIESAKKIQADRDAAAAKEQPLEYPSQEGIPVLDPEPGQLVSVEGNPLTTNNTDKPNLIVV